MKLQLNILPIDVSNIRKQPDKFEIELDGNDYIFKVFWNEQGQFFSFDMYEEDGPMIQGRRIVYGVNMLENIADERVPDVQIIPADKTGDAEKTGITFDNFMSSVKPVIVNE